MIQVAVTNGDFIGTRPKLGATGNGDDFRRDSLEMRGRFAVNAGEGGRRWHPLLRGHRHLLETSWQDAG